MSITVTTRRKDVILKSKEEEYQFDHGVNQKFSDQQKWTLHNYVHCDNHASYDFEKFDSTENLNEKTKPPKLSAHCYATRSAQYYFWNAYFLIFLITIMSFSVYAISYKNAQSRLQGIFTLVLTSISFRWVVNRSLPTVSYLTSLDSYAIANIVFLCFQAFANASIAIFFSEDQDRARLVNNIFVIIFASIFGLIHIVLGVWIIRVYIKVKAFRKKIHNLTKKFNKSELQVRRKV